LFRLFATANTLGSGDSTGLYQGTQTLNQGQLDRWQVVTVLNGLPFDREVAIIKAKVKEIAPETIEKMVNLAQLTRTAFEARDMAMLMSPRTVLTWAENSMIFNDVAYAFRVTFYNKLDVNEQPIVDEFYQRCFGSDN
jgi:cobaltochelatase CobS